MIITDYRTGEIRAVAGGYKRNMQALIVHTQNVGSLVKPSFI